MVPVLIIHAMKGPHNITIDLTWRIVKELIEQNTYIYFKEEKEKNDSKSKSWLKKDNI